MQATPPNKNKKDPATQLLSVPLWLLILITLSGTVAMHMFVPSLPDAGTELSASAPTMQMTISLYIIGLAIGQLFYGALSDAIGRKICLILGIVLFILSSIIASLATSIEVLLISRFLQALGGCSGLVLGKAIVKDTSTRNTLMSKLATMNLIVVLGPGLAPLIGNFLNSTYGWRSVFIVTSLFGGLILFFTLLKLPETGKPSGKFNYIQILKRYRFLSYSKSFLFFTIGGAFMTTSHFAFIAASPYIVQQNLSLAPEDSAYFVTFTLFGFSLGNLLIKVIYTPLGPKNTLLVGASLGLCSAFSLLLLSLNGTLNSFLLAFLLLMITTGGGICGAPALALALSLHPHISGTAAGFYGFFQMALGAISSYLSGFGSNPAITSFGLMSLTMMGAIFCFLYGIATKRH